MSLVTKPRGALTRALRGPLRRLLKALQLLKPKKSAQCGESLSRLSFEQRTHDILLEHPGGQENGSDIASALRKESRGKPLQRIVAFKSLCAVLVTELARAVVPA